MGNEHDPSRRDFIAKAGLFAGSVAAGMLSVEDDAAAAFRPQASAVPKPAKQEITYQKKYTTLAHRILEIEYDTLDTVTNEHFRGLDFILEKIIGKIQSKGLVKETYTREDAVAVFETIGSELENHGYKNAEGWSEEFSGKGIALLSEALERRLTDCDTNSLIYMAAGEILGMPVKGVNTPVHMLVRWNFDDGTFVNWETTQNCERKNHFYINMSNIDSSSLDKGVYLQPLSVQQVIANTLNSLGGTAYANDNNVLALKMFREAVKLNPLSFNGWFNLGLTYQQGLEKYEEAVEAYDKAIELDINNDSAWYNRANAKVAIHPNPNSAEAQQMYSRDLRMAGLIKESADGRRERYKEIMDNPDITEEQINRYVGAYIINHKK